MVQNERDNFGSIWKASDPNLPWLGTIFDAVQMAKNSHVLCPGKKH